MDVEFGGAKREIMRGNRDRERQKKKKRTRAVNSQRAVVVKCGESDLLRALHPKKNGHSTTPKLFYKSFIRGPPEHHTGNLLMQFQDKCRQSSALCGYVSP